MSFASASAVLLNAGNCRMLANNPVYSVTIIKRHANCRLVFNHCWADLNMLLVHTMKCNILHFDHSVSLNDMHT